ncbi:DUF4240 domain-containing protein [Streptomyces sp. DSM 44917]|uniref:DUF4240 domain-containing protein n=1 Tax=Streptomyces boetiae TaxID=3075541 RepID=A0ABU2L7Z4_9ACTN|nr:DUF4240 domain-containing protein [Streptomyces sp. DSM 44917]MDT0307586.1 DUF4240 domain-containing protein [Streptomyces sp. DSM 44917]
MDETDFWEIVDETREATGGGDPDAHADLLVERLAGLDPESVTDFARHFEARFNRAYRWDVWGAAWVLLGGGVGDDTFENFRCWLISQGRQVFEGTLSAPDELAALLPVDFDPVTDGEAEELGYAAYDAYEQLTGDQLPALGLPEAPREPAGDPVDFEDDAALAAAYPRLWERMHEPSAGAGGEAPGGPVGR